MMTSQITMKNPSALNKSTSSFLNLDLEELKRRCQTCHVSNPLVCKETCEVWKLKSIQNTLRKEIPDQPDYSTITTATRNPEHLKTLQLLSHWPHTVDRTNAKADVPKHHITELLQAGLILVDRNTYKLTPAGEKVLETLSQYPIEFSEKTEFYDEKVLSLLLGGTNTFDSLSEAVPQTELSIVLHRLKARGLLDRTSSRGDVLYFTTKRRPTRHLLPTELKIFKGIPKNGTTAKELSKRLGLTKPATYRYLRRLRYRRHVVRRRQELTFGLTPKGRQIAQFLEAISKTVRSLSPSDFA